MLRLTTHKRIRAATPRHNGKVERVHRMDSERFYVDREFCFIEDDNNNYINIRDGITIFCFLGLSSISCFRKCFF